MKRLSPEAMTALEFRKRIEACAATSNAPEVLKIFREMLEQSVPVQPYMYQMILNICGKSTTQENIAAEAFNVFEHMKASLVGHSANKKKHPIDESSYSALIKLCAEQDNTTRALALVDELEANDVAPKLRTFAPLLHAFAAAKDLAQAWWVYDKLRAHGIDATEAEYAALLQCATATRDAALFYKALDVFCDAILVPTKRTWEVLKAWFVQEEWKWSVGTVTDAGVCSVTGAQLASVELSADKEAALATKVENLVCTTDERVDQWNEFKQWLEAHGPFDVLIDAANVGYFAQNFEGGGFNYKQIETVLKAYEAKGKKTLIVLHKRRTKDHQVPEHHRAMVAQWKERGVMFNCLPGNNDDWYWLYAAVKFSGRTLVVSNDEMRDHHFQMIHNEDFRRWKERHLVHYEVRGAKLELFEPSVYSHRSQHLASSWHFPAVDSDDWLVVHR
ncbi:Aste57867_11192 [Aphanomyces stellatus]|uniref:Mitochondrial ribonuclease P catalytic subunit n=1 Tax=Aphanomyces stellatus TaxID=120398 RepID=A0A485KSQ4_9STRA|nr:hypothetical protein As57867_011150 [Aphanomyces stellatus]VFT88059.1 Aste57867_11192 [Aphanomyces stellatus]